jgi:hypothetical protein
MSPDEANMKRILRILFGAGCLTSVLAPVFAIVFYPRANWLFAFPLAGIGLLLLRILTHKGPTPLELADQAERILEGSAQGWDVDDYEHMDPKDPKLKDLWLRTMSVGDLPERWPGLDSEKKTTMREIITQIRQMASSS